VLRDDLYVWRRRREERREPTAHYHHCPVCYAHWACTLVCAIEPDLGEHRGAPMGAHCRCDECEREVHDER
jgi:hypothetical protein